jgi:hypothetical protein
MKIFFLPILALLPLLQVACTEKDSKVRLNVTVKTNQGDPIDGAEISLDGKPIGVSATTGAFQTELDLKMQSRQRLEVKKNSDAYYFAPFFESFIVSSNPTQDVNITATLYFVPKPTPDGAVMEAAEPTPEEPVVPNEIKKAGEEEKLAEEKLAEESESSKPSRSGKPEEISEAKESPESAKAAPLSLTPVGSDQVTDAAGNPVYPKPVKAKATKDSDTILTVHVMTGGGSLAKGVGGANDERPIADAQIFIGQQEEGDLKAACVTNPRGRCVIRFSTKPTEPVTFIAKKSGYQTKSVTSHVAAKGQLRILMLAGQSIDIFAITKSYNHVLGLNGVEVFIKGKRVGTTDRFGHYAYVYHGRPDDLVAIALKPKAYLPEVYETDFVANGPMTLVRYFMPEIPPPVRMTLLQVQPAGQFSKKDAQAFAGSLDENLRVFAKKHIYSTAAFKDYSLALFTSTAKKLGLTPTDMLRKGWQETDLKASVDALLLPTLLILDKPVLELSVVDSKGQILAAAKEELDSLNDKAAIDRAVSVIAKKIIRTFPFEGAILSKNANRASINLGYRSGRGIKSGDELEVFGMQAGKLGRTQTHKKIAQLTVREVGDEASSADVSKLMPRATLGRGDLVVLRTRKAPEIANAFVQVKGNIYGVTSEALPQANVYLNDQWLGATDEEGRLYFDVTGTGTLKVIKHGYQQFSQSVTLKASEKGRVTVNLRRETAFLRVESKPSAATVKVDGVVVGKTPLNSPIPVPAGFVKLEVQGPADYKVFSTVLELGRGTLDLSGANMIVLEQDLIAAAEPFLKNGQFAQAVARLSEIPKDHSQYLQAQHAIGEIYLTKLDEPAKAAAAFGLVTQSPEVKEFSDKRFIGAHINEGIALFMTADKLILNNPEAAQAHYLKAIEVLTAVQPQLRFVPSAQYSQAVHNVDFHIAMAYHKMWVYTKSPQMLADAVRSWRSYLEGSARSIPAKGSGKIYVENARVYYKQAQASLMARAFDGEQVN